MQSAKIEYLRHTLATALVAGVGLAGLVVANKHFAPEMYSSDGPVEIAETLAAGKNYAVFDLNINIREIRDAQIARLAAPPDVVILGASHWQEAHAYLVPDATFYNAHVHRDYYEDIPAVAGMFVRHKKLPRTMVIAIRDNLFTPVADRRDHLWLPGVPYYRAIAGEFGIEAHAPWVALPAARWREQISVPMLFENVTRWFNAEEHPHASEQRYFKTLDTLLPDGSIIWSREHRALFTERRTKALSKAAAADIANRPPQLDPKGIATVDAVLAYLRREGVEVVLAMPPFNPDYFERLRDTPYMTGLRRVDALIKDLAAKHSARVIGSYDPADVGCTESMFIDSEHANPDCLGRVFDQLGPGAPGSKLPMIADASAAAFNPGKRQLAPLQSTLTSRDPASGPLASDRVSPAPAHASTTAAAATQAVPAGAPAAAETRMMARVEPFEPAVNRKPARATAHASDRRDRGTTRNRAATATASASARSRDVASQQPRRERVRFVVSNELVWPGDTAMLIRVRSGGIVPYINQR